MQVARALIPMGSILVFISGGALVAQGTPGWRPVHLGREVAAALCVRILDTGDSFQVFFRNVGTTTVHFGFYMEGIQTQDDVSANGRVHLKPGNLSGALAVKVHRPIEGVQRVRAVQVVVGEPDVASPDASEEPKQ